MNESELRQEVARLRRKDVSDLLWNRLWATEWVTDFFKGRLSVEDLVDEANALEQYAREEVAAKRQRTQEKPQTISANHGEYVVERGRAHDEALALKAACTTEVRDLRARILGGTPLSVPLARRLLDSEVARVWSLREFERRGIPIVGHRAVATANRVTDEDGRDVRTIDVKVTWGDQVLDTTLSRVLPTSLDHVLQDPVLHFVDERGKKFSEDVRQGSVMDRLRQLSERLVRTFGFDAAQATWFILTDTSPRRSPLDGNIAVQNHPTHVDGRVTLSMDLWVPADVVLRVYRDVQRQRLGRENRPLSLSNLAVYRSVLQDARDAERANPGCLPPTRAQSMARWNREHPEKQYQQEWEFKRDVERAERLVLFPGYLPKPADDNQGATS